MPISNVHWRASALTERVSELARPPAALPRRNTASTDSFYRLPEREKRRQRNSDRLFTSTGVAIGRWIGRSRKLRAWASRGRYCGEIWPTG